MWQSTSVIPATQEVEMGGLKLEVRPSKTYLKKNKPDVVVHTCTLSYRR
jgi:hypothetical protein